MVDFFHFQGYISKLSDGKGHLQLDRSEQHCVSNCRKSLFFIILAGGAFFGASEAYSLTAASTASGWNLSFWPVPALWGAGLAAGALLARCLPQRLLPPIGLLVLEILLLLQPGTPWRSATAGLLAGGVLSMLPAGSGGVLCRIAGGAGFAAGFAVDILCFHGGCVPGLLLLPVLLLAVLCALPLCGPWRLLPILLLPVAVFLFSPIYSAESLRRPPRNLKEVSIAPALPASLMPAVGEGMHFLFVSDLHSPLPAVWAALPYVASVDCVWPRAAARFGEASLKVNSYEGRPGRILPELSRRYDLVYLENLPPVSAAALRSFLEAALGLLRPDRGVLVVPAAFREMLPENLHIAELPGGNGRFLAASRDAALTADLGVLDRRLQGHQRAFSEDNLFMPAGIFAALYAATEESLAVSTSFPVVNPPPTGFHLPAGLPRLLLWCVLAAWLLLRTVCGRSGSGLARVLAVENGAVFSLVLLSAWQGFDRRELFTGIPSLLPVAAGGLLLFDSVLRPRVERWFVAVAALMPFALLLPWRFLLFGAGYLLVTVCAALAAGMVRFRLAVRPESRLASSGLVFWSGAGLFAGALLFELIGILLPGGTAAAAAAALLLRIGWFCF